MGAKSPFPVVPAVPTSERDTCLGVYRKAYPPGCKPQPHLVQPGIGQLPTETVKVRPSRFSPRAVVAVPFRTGDGGSGGGRGQLSSTSDRAFLHFNFRSKSEVIDIKHFFLPRAPWPPRTGQIQK